MPGLVEAASVLGSGAETSKHFPIMEDAQDIDVCLQVHRHQTSQVTI
jgi:hypothetical protein